MISPEIVDVGTLLQNELDRRTAARQQDVSLVENPEYTVDVWKIAGQILNTEDQVRRFICDQIIRTQLARNMGKRVSPVGLVTSNLTFLYPGLNPEKQKIWSPVYTELLRGRFNEPKSPQSGK